MCAGVAVQLQKKGRRPELIPTQLTSQAQRQEKKVYHRTQFGQWVQFPAQLGREENSGERVSSFHVFSVLVAWAGKRSKDSAISSGSADRLCCSAAVGKCEMVRKGEEENLIIGGRRSAAPLSGG